MITDRDTNKIFLSHKLKLDYPIICGEIENILKSFNSKYDFLPNTQDIWARDYMPIQISDKIFIEYRYDPDYLQGEWKGYRDLKTYPDIVCNSINRETIKTDIILDGGNIVKSKNCIILTDKVVKENRIKYKKNELLKELKRVFDVEKVILIPWDKKEKFGHSDGMLRFIDDNTVLINEIYEEDNELLNCLRKNGLKAEVLRVKIKKQSKWNWAYINFLQTKDLILLPKFGIEEDQKALEQICYFYSEYAEKKRIAQIEMKDIVKKGGALNCITWTIKEN